MEQEIPEKKVYIAGAHSRARTLKAYLEYLYPETKVVSYLVDDMNDNAEITDGIPVELIREGLCVEYPVYIGTRSANHDKITMELLTVGFSEIIPVTVELDIYFRNKYVRKFYQEQGKPFVLIDDL